MTKNLEKLQLVADLNGCRCWVSAIHLPVKDAWRIRAYDSDGRIMPAGEAWVGDEMDVSHVIAQMSLRLNILLEHEAKLQSRRGKWPM